MVSVVTWERDSVADDLEKEENADQVRDLGQKVLQDVREGGYAPNIVLSALAVVAVWVCRRADRDDPERAFRTFLGKCEQAWQSPGFDPPD